MKTSPMTPDGQMVVGTKQWRDVVPLHLQDPLAKALHASEARDFKTALYWFGKCAELEPMNRVVLYFGSSAAQQAYFGLRGAGSSISPAVMEGWRDCAETLTKAAFEVAPDDAVACHNVGRFIQDCGKDEEAIAYYEQAAKLDGGQVETWANMGTAYAMIGDMDRANRYWDRALYLDPRHPTGLLSQGYILLRRGQWKDGWEKFEARWKDREFVTGYGRKDLGKRKVWHGERLHHGESVLFHGEQGLGDHVQFARFVKAAHDLGIPIAGFETRGTLKRWMEQALPDVTILTRDVDPLPASSHHASIMSLPHLIGAQSGYCPPPVAPPLARQPTPSDGLRRVGLAWHGAAGNPADYARSIPHDQLAHLKGTRVRWVNLQYDDLADMRIRAWLGNDCENATAGVRDVLDTAERMVQLDCVVTVDTLTAHLAGSLGIPTRLLQRFAAEWRWGTGDGATDWYPSITQIRQPAPHAWQPVLEQVKQDLSA